jgi:putative peptide maturation system protein
MDGFRREHGLHQAADTYRWLERHGMSHEKLERYVADEALVGKLCARVTAGRVEGYFEEHRADFDTAGVARIEFADEARARQAGGRVRSGAVDFFQAAQDEFLRGDPGPQPPDGLFAVIRRREAAGELGEAVFGAAPGEVVGPVRTGNGHALVRVLSREPARLDAATRRVIKKILFEGWLEERRREATIEWFWGNAGKTDKAG